MDRLPWARSTYPDLLRPGRGCRRTATLPLRASGSVRDDPRLGAPCDPRWIDCLGLARHTRICFGQGADAAEQQRFLSAHPDLYEMTHGSVRLAIRDGSIALGSLDIPGFASGRARMPPNSNASSPRIRICTR